MLKIARSEFNLMDDVFFKRIAFVLYAQGCKWGCKGCHSKDLWTFEGGKDFGIEDLDKALNMVNLSPKEITIVGQGGDFWFQRDEWIAFCKLAKEKYPDILIAWQTGATREMVREIFPDDIFPFDAIACERPFADKDSSENRKYVIIRTNKGIQEGWKIL